MGVSTRTLSVRLKVKNLVKPSRSKRIIGTGLNQHAKKRITLPKVGK